MTLNISDIYMRHQKGYALGVRALSFNKGHALCLRTKKKETFPNKELKLKAWQIQKYLPVILTAFKGLS